MTYILDLPKYLIDNLLDYVSYLSMLSHLPRFKINIYAYWISISVHWSQNIKHNLQNIMQHIFIQL